MIPEYVKQINDWQKPKTRKEVSMFISAEYCGKYAYFSTI